MYLAKPTTGSSESCKLPFQINQKDYYFCQLNNTNYECKIQNGENKVCNRGKIVQ